MQNADSAPGISSAASPSASQPFAPEPGRLSERIADLVLARIASGEWAPGKRLPGERRLAEEMGVSRVSIRAALQSLKTQGYLSAVQGGGTRVISKTATIESGLDEIALANQRNFHDLAEIRGLLEVWAARRAAQAATPDHLDELSAVLAATEADVANGKHKTENDLRFHLAVAKAAQSPVYVHLMGSFRRMLSQMMELHRYEMFATPDHDAAILADHRAIFEGIRARDSEAAARAMAHHLGWVEAEYRGSADRWEEWRKIKAGGK
jgi:GntR family transcriptional regulator, transcriptional repressor for pyruvate dehydrogenase complex